MADPPLRIPARAGTPRSATALLDTEARAITDETQASPE